MNSRDFNRYYAQYRCVITAMARKLVGSDHDLVEDLEQIGAIALWKLNPANAKTNVDAWIRQSIKYRQIDYLRKLNPQMYCSLDAAMERGDQLEQDPISGELILRYHPNNRVIIVDDVGFYGPPDNDVPTRDEQVEDLIKQREEHHGE
jgi:DNA-directed RNA polymerase specialized sigma24 family protein